MIETGAGIEHAWAILAIAEYSGDDEPQKLYFEKGHEPLIREVLRRLAQRCGPLVLLDDAGGPPAIVTD